MYFASRRIVQACLMVALPLQTMADLTQVNDFSLSGQMAYPAAGNDLINQGQPTFLSQTVSGYTPFTWNGTSDVNALNDGQLGSGSSNTNTAFDMDGTWTSTFNLNTTLHPLGYDLTRIRTISGWIDTRTNQSYQVSYSRVEQPTKFYALGTYSYLPATSGGGDSSARMTLTAAAGSALIAANVAAVQFSFRPAGGTATVYREVDVEGVFSNQLHPAPSSPTRIMPVGDSITRGSNFNGDVPGGYRTRLQENLTSAGKSFEMVGSSTENPPPNSLGASHNGCNGWRIDQIRDSIDGWLATSNPDVVLLHIGTNDMLQNYQVSTLATRLDDLVGRIVSQDSHAEIFVASIIPITQDYNGLTMAQYTSMVDAYNAQIPGIVSKYAGLGDNVHFVDMHNLITLTDPNNPASNFFQPGDGIHPGQAGYDQMGDIWYTEIQSSVPEPGSLTLLTAAAGLLGLRRRVIR